MKCLILFIREKSWSFHNQIFDLFVLQCYSNMWNASLANLKIGSKNSSHSSNINCIFDEFIKLNAFELIWKILINIF